MSFIAEKFNSMVLHLTTLLLIPAYSSAFLRNVSLTTKFSRRIELKVPILQLLWIQ